MIEATPEELDARLSQRDWSHLLDGISPSGKIEGRSPVPGVDIEHKRPWWYRLALRLCPGRCREIPEAANPDRLVLRQVALWKRYAYLQQFASAEDPRFMHSHPYRWMLAIGLWGGYTEHRIAGASRRRSAPYCYTLDGSHVHHVQEVTSGHTSIFIGVGRAVDSSVGDKRYFGAPTDEGAGAATIGPTTITRTWQDHIRVKVARL